MRQRLGLVAAIIVLVVFADGLGNAADTEPYQVRVTNEISGDVSVIDGATLEVRTLVPLDESPTPLQVGNGPRTFVFTPDGSKAYVPNEIEGTVSIFDADKRKVTGVIRLDGHADGESAHPREAIVSPDGRSLYVSTGRGQTIVHIDTRIDKILRTVRVGARPWGLAVSPDGRRIFAANGPSNDVSVIDADSFEVIATVPVGKGPSSVAVVRR